MTSTCCQSLERSSPSPFEFIQLGWYDGITSALARCRACGRTYHAEMVARGGDEDMRVYGFRDISPASYAAMARASNEPWASLVAAENTFVAARSMFPFTDEKGQ